MKTRKTKKRNIIRRTVAFLLCMTMVLGLGMQDVIEQVYAEGLSAVSQEQSAPETQNVESTAPTTPEEETDPTASGEIVPVTPEEEPTAPEEDKEPTEPANPADTEENTDVTTPPAETTEPSAPEEPTTPADGTENTEPAAPVNSDGSGSSDETVPVEDTETEGEGTPSEGEELPVEEVPVSELTYASEDGSFSVKAAAASEDVELSGIEIHAAQVQKDGEEADRYATAEELVAGALEAESRQIEELQAYDIWFTYTESGETADLSGQVQISLEYTAPEFPEGTDAQLEVFCLNGGAAEAVDGTDALAAGCELYALAWAVPAGYDETWEDDQVIIRVAAEDGVLPAGAELSVTPIVKTEDMSSLTEEQQDVAEEINAQYDLTEKKLNEEVEENGETLGGFLAYDISFLVNGEKTEPNGNVSVTMEFKEAVLPEGVSEDARVSVKHLKEDADAGDGIAVEDVSEKAEVQNAENAAVEKVMLSADSFSTYAITWAYASGTVTIEDKIISDDVLQAEYTGSEEVEFKWYKSDDENGTYTPVLRVDYQGGASNLSEDGSALYPAYDEGARAWYKVEVVSGEEVLAESEPCQVPYYNELQNGSFETPEYRVSDDYNTNAPETMTQVSNEDYKNAGGVWQTTGTYYDKDKREYHDIEILGAGKTVPIKNSWGNIIGFEDGLSQYYAWQEGQTPKAYNGVQFAELNCQTAGALYQDVLTVPGTELNYALSHRARGDYNNITEYDTMFLVIMPTKDSQDLITQNDLETQLEDWNITVDYNNQEVSHSVVYNDKENGILVVRITSSDQDWHRISEIAGYTPTSSMTRFFFMAGKTGADDNTVGNFLDYVSFSQDLPPVANDEFTLEIKKEFEGLSQAEISKVKDNIKFTISATNQEGESLNDDQITDLFGTTVITGSNMEQSADGSLVWSVVNRKIDEGQIYNVTITESDAELDDSYTLNTTYQTSVKVGDVDAGSQGGTGNVTTITLQGETVAEVMFTNTYTQLRTKDVNFTKIWDDNKDSFDTRPKSLTVTLNATVTVDGEQIKLGAEDLGLSTLDLTITEDNKVGSDKNRWRATWQEVPVYYVHNGQQLPIEYAVTEGELDTQYVYEVTQSGKGDGSSFTEGNMTNFSNVMKPKTGTPSMTNSISSVAANGENDELGAPAHRKYITYDETTEKYTLNLDVTGKKGDAEGVDILFVIDNSPSMAGNRHEKGLIDEVQELLTGGRSNPDNGIIDQIFAAAGNVNSVAYVEFGGDASSDNRWYTSENKGALEQKINDLDADNSSTNWRAAMRKADDVLRLKANSENEKVVIFLSDGAPNAGYDGQDWVIFPDTENYCNSAIRAVNSSVYLNQAEIYSVYLNDNSKTMMEKFANGVEGVLVDGTELSEALTGILQMIIPEYKNVVIYDTLTKWVNPVEESDITVWKKPAGSNSESKLPTSDYDVTVTDGGKAIKVELLKGGALDDGATYIVKFEVSPSQAAIDDYAEKGYYPHEGEEGTNTYRQPGYFTNLSASVEYQVNGQKDSYSEPYNKPVIQLPEPSKADITIKKVWVTNGETEEPEEINVVLYQSVNGNTPAPYGDDITLKASEGWTVTVPECLLRDGEDKYSYSVEEVSVPEGYTSWIKTEEDSSGNLTFTITNTYDRYSVDENYYIVNTLQTDRLQVTKNWEGDKDQQELRKPVTIRITDSLNQMYDVDLDADVDWTKTIVVPRLSEAGYQAEELVVPENYQVSVASVTGGDGVYVVSVTNTLQTISIDVRKVWKDGELGNRSDVQFEVQQWDEDSNSWVGTGKRGVLSAPKWSTTITGLKAGLTYQVVETNVPSGYKSNTTQDDVNSFVITNTLQWNMVKTDKLLAGEEESDRSYLPGAEFELYQTSDNQKVATGTSSEDTEKRGIIEWTFEGEVNLNGEYKIVETKAPDGYQINENGWTVVFQDGIPVEFDGKAITFDDVKENGIVLILENEMLYELPSTGGPGIYLYMLGGVALMMAGTLLVYKKRKEEVLRS